MCYSFFWNRLNIFLGKLNCTCCCCWLCLQAWSKLLSPVSEDLPRSINLFMAVPTIYAKLIENYDERVNSGPDSNHTQDYIKTTCSSKIRCFTYQWLLVIIWVFCSWIMTITRVERHYRLAEQHSVHRTAVLPSMATIHSNYFALRLQREQCCHLVNIGE